MTGDTAPPTARDDWIIDLPAGTARQAAAAAVGRLRAAGRFRCVSHGYKTPGSGTEIALLDRFAVQFKPGVTPANVDSLSTAAGTRIVRTPQLDSVRFESPAKSRSLPQPPLAPAP